MSSENITEYIIKYNVSEKLFYSPKKETPIIQIYDYQLLKDNDYNLDGIQRFIIRNKQLYKILN